MRRLFVIGFLLMVTATLAGCLSTGPSTSQPADDTGETTSVCTGRGYYNDTFKFGFDPPAGYVGPAVVGISPYAFLPLLNESFIVPLLNTRRIDVNVFSPGSGLTQWVAALRAQRLLEGNVQISSETFTTDSGAPATFLVWSSSRGVIYEVFAARSSFIVALHSQLSLIDSALSDQDIRTAFRSLCVETP